jgi:integrase
MWLPTKLLPCHDATAKKWERRSNPPPPPKKRRFINRLYLTAAGLKSRRITPHSLRHTAITLAINGGNGDNLLRVQQMARHGDISTTLGYFHEFDRLKNAAERSIKI